jgi:hypothetical protein
MGPRFRGYDERSAGQNAGMTGGAAG